MPTLKSADIRRVAGVLASDSRRRLWASIVIAGDRPPFGLRLDDLSARERRDLRALADAGVVLVEEGVVSEVPSAFRDALAGSAQTRAITGIVTNMTPGDSNTFFGTGWGISQQSFHPTQYGTTLYATALLSALAGP